jgi:hypothetical protein
VKIGEKAYAKWALYLNKNYSYCSSKPFYQNAPVDWGERRNVLSALTTEKSMFHALLSSAPLVHWMFQFLEFCSWHMWSLQATKAEQISQIRDAFKNCSSELFLGYFGRC